MRFVAMIAAVVGSVLSQSAFAQLPQTRLSSIFPPGAQKGTTVEVTVGGGTDLDELDQMVFSHPGIVATPKMDANGVMVANVFAVTIAADVPPGLYDCRVRGLFGVSNPRLFRIDTLPEIAEVEPNNARAQATPVTLGSIVNARANGGTDVDFYSVKVTTGQTLVLRSECARLDSPMQPWIQLFAANGRRLAESRRVFGQEANLVFTATQDEELIVRVQDTVYGGGDQFVYRLSFDSRSLVDWIEPSFVAANGPTNVTLFGRHLPGGTPTEKKLAGHAVFQQQVTIDPATARGPVGASATAAFADSFWWNGIDGNLVRVGQSERPAVQEAVDPAEQPVTTPFDISGSFSERADEDIYRFDAKKGEAWVIEVFAQRMGSNADPLLMVERINTAADGKVTYARVATEDDDRQNPGGADLPTLGDDPSFRLDVPEDGSYRIRLRDRYADTRNDPRLTYRLTVRPPKPDFRLVVFEAFPSNDGKAPVTTGAASLRKGGSYELNVYAYRTDGHNDTIELNAMDLPPGVTARGSKIGPGQAFAKLVLTAAPDANEMLVPIRVVGKSGPAESLIQRDAKVATLVHDAINGLPRTARLTDSMMIGVMKDEQPFSIVTDAITADLSQDQQLLVPIRIVKRTGFDGKVDLTFYGLPAEIDAPPVAIEPGKDSVVARLYLKENAPVSTSTVLVQGTSSVPYRRNPWQADRAKGKVTEAEAAVVARQAAVAKAEEGLKTSQQMVVTLTEETKKLAGELAAYAAQQQKLRDEFSKAIGDQKVSLDALAKVQSQLGGLKTDGNTTPDQFNAAIQAVKDASAAADEAAKKLEALSASATELAKQVAAAKEMEASKLKEKTAAEENVAKFMKEIEATQAALAAAKKDVETATAAKKTADDVLKKAEEASAPKPLNVRVISEPIVLAIHQSPAKLAAAVPDGGAIKKGGSVTVKVTVNRKNNFAGAVRLNLAVPDGITSIKAEPVDVAADQTEGTLTISAAPDAAAGDVSNVVVRATADFNGRSASTDVPVALKIVE